jgi:hypothetical protein
MAVSSTLYEKANICNGLPVTTAENVFRSVYSLRDYLRVDKKNVAMFGFDSETLLNATAAVVTIIAVSIFIFSVKLGISYASQILIVATFLTGVFGLAQRAEDQQLVFFAYGVIVISLLMLFAKTVGTFDLGSEVTVVGLLAIAAILFASRSALNSDDRFITGRQAVYALVVFALITTIVLTTDVATGGPRYDLQLDDTIAIPEGGDNEVRVGSLVATNPTPLPERVEEPQYEVCTAGNWSEYRPDDNEDGRIPVRSDLTVESTSDDHVLSYSSKSYPVELGLIGQDIAGESLVIERTSECPNTNTGDPYLAVFQQQSRGQSNRITSD